MKEVGKELLISGEELRGFGISPNTIGSWRDKAKIRRQKIDGKLYFLYSTVPPITKNNLPPLSELLEKARIEAENLKKLNKDLEDQEKENKVKQLALFIENQYNVYFAQHLGQFKGKVTEKKAVLLAKKTEMINCLVDLKTDHFKRDLHSAHLLIKDAPYYQKNYNRFAPDLIGFQQALEQGQLYTKLLPKNLGKKNAVKISKDNLPGKAIIDWYSDPKKPSACHVKTLYDNCREAKNTDWPKVEIRAIQKFLQRPEIKTLWYQKRHGKAAAREYMEPTIKRRKTTRPGAVWWADGTALQFVLVNDKNKVTKSLYTYLVADSYSGAIIGNAYGYTEASPLVTNSLKKAVTAYGYLPEYLGYDNSRANRAVEVQDLMTKMSRVHFPCEPYNGRAKKIEGIIRILEQRYMRLHPFFKGGNITTKSLNSKANPEYLIELHINGELPEISEAIQAYEDCIKAYNEDKGTKKTSRIERYLEPFEGRRKAEPLDYCSLFMNKRRMPVKYTSEGLTIEVAGEEHTYQVVNKAGKIDYDFHSQYLGEKFEIHADNEELSLIALFKDGVFITFATKKTEFSEVPTDHNEGEKAKLNKELKDRKAYLDENQRKVEGIASELREASIPEMSFKAVFNFKDSLNKEEEQIQNDQLGLDAFQEETTESLPSSPGPIPEQSLEQELINFFYNQ